MTSKLFGLAKRVGTDIGEHNLSIIAAGMAYNAVFALFPALASMVSVYGLVADPATVAGQIETMAHVLPGDITSIVGEELHRLVSTSNSALGLSLIVSLLIALWSVASGIKAVIGGLNIAYDAKEKRGFFKVTAIALGLALGFIVFALLSLSLVAAVPIALKVLGLEQQIGWMVSVGRWPILALLVILALSVIYRWGPCRLGVHWRFITWGAALCTTLWIIGSALLSLYVSSFAKFDQTYGSIGGAMALLLWLYFSAFTILLGAELDAELEQRQGIATSREVAQDKASHRHAASSPGE
jgi:membrane protein